MTTGVVVYGEIHFCYRAILCCVRLVFFVILVLSIAKQMWLRDLSNSNMIFASVKIFLSRPTTHREIIIIFFVKNRT